MNEDEGFNVRDSNPRLESRLLRAAAISPVLTLSTHHPKPHWLYQMDLVLHVDMESCIGIP